MFEIYLKSDLGSIFYDFLYTVFLNDPTVFLLYFTGLSCSKQQEKHTFGNISRCFLRTLFWDGFGMTFSCFLLFFGSLLATFFVAFWTPFWHRFSEGLRDSAKVKAGREVVAIGGYLGRGVRCSLIVSPSVCHHFGRFWHSDFQQNKTYISGPSGLLMTY